MEGRSIGASKIARKLAKLAGIENREHEVVRMIVDRYTIRHLEELESKVDTSSDPNLMARRIVYRATGILSTYNILNTLRG